MTPFFRTSRFHYYPRFYYSVSILKQATARPDVFRYVRYSTVIIKFGNYIHINPNKLNN